MSARGHVHKTYHSAAGCGASMGVLAFTSLLSHYKRETNAGFGVFFFFFCQMSLWVFFVHTQHQYTTFWKSAHLLLTNESPSFFKALAVSFCILTGRPTTTGRAAPGLGPALGPETGLVAGGWPGMFRRLNLGTTATLTLRLGRAWTDGRPWKSEQHSRGNWYVMRQLSRSHVLARREGTRLCLSKNASESFPSAQQMTNFANIKCTLDGTDAKLLK